MGVVSQARSIGEELSLGGKGQKRECPRKEDRGDTMGPLGGQGKQFQENVGRGDGTSGPEGWGKDPDGLARGTL